MNSPDFMQQLHNLFVTASKDEVEMLVQYLRKFIPSDLPVKEECCQKYCTRSNGRYCHTCPNHPLRSSNSNLLHPICEEALSLISQADYVSYILLLKENNLPYPSVKELYDLLYLK